MLITGSTGMHEVVIFRRLPPPPLPHLLLLFPLILLSIITATAAGAVVDADPGTLNSNNNRDHSFVTARIGSSALIPCNLTLKQVPEDFVTLVLWYKDDMGGAPIFTIDARSRPLGSAPRVPSQELGERASFDLTTHPAFLKISPLTKEDDGLYKCRVDYRRGRTVSTTTYLNVVVPPERIVILNEKRDEVRGTRIGLLPEDSQLKLICRTEGGRPQPSVHWIKDGSVIDDTFTTINDRSLGFIVENELVLHNISRSDLNSVLSCEAINSNLTSRTALSVRLELSYAPMCKEGQKLSYGASIGETIAISCDVESSPSPTMFYWIFHSSLLTSSSTASPLFGDASSAASTLVTEVIGSSSNDQTEGNGPASDRSIASPLTSSSGGSGSISGNMSLSSKPIKSLPATSFTSGSRAETSGRSKSHLFMSSQHTPSHESPAAAAATASGSDTNSRINNRNSASNSITSDIQYNHNNNHNNHHQPQRKQEQQQQHQLSHGTAGLSNSKLKYVSDGNRSWLYLTPKSKADFGTVECWATNGIGKQKNACSFSVYPAGPPEGVRDCVVHNQSSDSAAVISCSAGYDGGLKQSFVLEVYDRRKEQLMKNLTQDDDPRFRLQSLAQNTPYAFVVYSYNMKGKSARISVNYQITAVLPQDSTDPSATAVSQPPASSSSSSTVSYSSFSSPVSSAGTSAGSDSASDSANESRSGDGASLPSSSFSSPSEEEASSLSSLLMRVALLPVLGIVSGLVLTFVLLGVIFSVLHIIRKQERRSGKAGGADATATSAGVPLGLVIPGTSPSASCDSSSAAFHHPLHDQENRDHESSYGQMPFIGEHDEESKREFLQIISSSSIHHQIQDPDLIPLSCKSLPSSGNLIQDLKCLDADLVRDHPHFRPHGQHHHHPHPHAAQNLLTQSSIQFIHSPGGDLVSESGRMDSITERTMTTDSNMTSISESMSPFIEVNGSGMDLLHESVDASAGMLILPVSSSNGSAAASELLIPRTSYQMSPGGSIGFNRHPDVSFMKSLMATRSSSHPFTEAGEGGEEHQENPHQLLHHGMQVHQMQHHQTQQQQPAEHSFKQEQGHAYYYRDEGTNAAIECDQGLGSQLSHLSREAHLWHHSTPASESSFRDSLSLRRRKSTSAVVQTISGSERGDEDGCRLLTGYSTPV